MKNAWWYAIGSVWIMGLLGRLPGLAILLLAAYVLLPILLIVLFITQAKTIELWASLFCSPLFIGHVFQLMHWPSAGAILTFGSLGLLLLGVVVIVRGATKHKNIGVIVAGIAILLHGAWRWSLMMRWVNLDFGFWYAVHALLLAGLLFVQVRPEKIKTRSLPLILMIFGIYSFHQLATPLIKLLRGL